MRPFEEGQEERITEAVSKRIDEYLAKGHDIGFGAALSSGERIEHVTRIGVSILGTKWGLGFPGGSFVQAIVDNDLTGAFGRADHINVNTIRFYVSLVYNQSYIQ